MFWNKDKKLFRKWLNFAVISIAEHDRVYDNLLENSKAKVNTNSDDYLTGKYLFRTFASAFIVSAVGFEQKMKSDSKFNQLQETVKLICIMGTESIDSSLLDFDVSIEAIPIDSLKPIQGGRGAKFLDESQVAFAKYMMTTEIEHVSDELVKLYCEALSFCINDIKEEDNITNAMSMFAGARKAIADRA